MAGDSVRLVGSKQNDLAKIDFLTFFDFAPPPPDLHTQARIHYMGLAPCRGRVPNLCVTTGRELDGQEILGADLLLGILEIHKKCMYENKYIKK